MAELTRDQRLTRDRVERVIAAIAPALDLVLAAGDRLSRIVERQDSDPRPVRAPRGPALLSPSRPEVSQQERKARRASS